MPTRIVRMLCILFALIASPTHAVKPHESKVIILRCGTAGGSPKVVSMEVIKSGHHIYAKCTLEDGTEGKSTPGECEKIDQARVIDEKQFEYKDGSRLWIKQVLCPGSLPPSPPPSCSAPPKVA